MKPVWPRSVSNGPESPYAEPPYAIIAPTPPHLSFYLYPLTMLSVTLHDRFPLMRLWLSESIIVRVIILNCLTTKRQTGFS